VITNGMSDYNNLLVIIAHIICNHPLYSSLNLRYQTLHSHRIIGKIINGVTIQPSNIQIILDQSTSYLLHCNRIRYYSVNPWR